MQCSCLPVLWPRAWAPTDSSVQTEQQLVFSYSCFHCINTKDLVRVMQRTNPETSSHWHFVGSETSYWWRGALPSSLERSPTHTTPLSTCLTFRVTLQKATSGWQGTSCACGQHLQGPCLYSELLWQEDLPAAIWRNSRYIKYRQLFTTEPCCFALKVLEAVCRHGNSETSPWLYPEMPAFVTNCTWETLLVPYTVANS